MVAPRSDDRILRVLIAGTDADIEAQFKTALAGIQGAQGFLHFAGTYRQAVEVARGRQPDLVVVELDRDAEEVAAFTRDLKEVSPASAVVVAYRQDQFEESPSDGTVFVDLLRANVRDFLRKPLSAPELRGVLDRVLERQAVRADNQGQIVAFFANKGGAGTSTIAVNVACALALRHPDEVLLIDACVQGGSCAFMLDLHPATGLVDAVREKDRLDLTLLRHLSVRHEESGLRVLAAPVDALEGSEVDDEAFSRILLMAQRTFKYVIVDSFSALDNVATALMDLASQTFVVVQSLAPAVASAGRLLPVLDGLGVPVARQRLIVSHTYPPFLGYLRDGDISDRLQRPIDHTVPYDKRVAASVNVGSPQVLHARWWQRFGRAVQEIADAIDGASDTRPDVATAAAPARAENR